MPKNTSAPLAPRATRPAERRSVARTGRQNDAPARSVSTQSTEQSENLQNPTREPREEAIKVGN